MGHKKDVRQFAKLAVRRKGLSFVHVEKCAEPSGFQRVDERLLVYYRSSRGVHKKRPLSEKRKLVFPYQPAGLFSQRGVDGHDVALRQYPVKSRLLGVYRFHESGVYYVIVVKQKLDSERNHHPDQILRHGAYAYDTHGLADETDVIEETVLFPVVTLSHERGLPRHVAESGKDIGQNSLCG